MAGNTVASDLVSMNNEYRGTLRPEGVILTSESQGKSGDQQAGPRSIGALVLVSAACCCHPKGGLAQP